MPLARSEKEQVVAEMAERMRRTEVVVVTDYRGLSVAQISSLRRKLRQGGAEMTVIKNTLVKRALEAAGLEPMDELLEGPTALVLLYEDLSGPTKALKETAKDTEVLEIKGGLMGGRLLDRYAVEALADLPTKEELLASILGVIQGPPRQLVTVLSAPHRDLLGVLNARVAAGEDAAAA